MSIQELIQKNKESFDKKFRTRLEYEIDLTGIPEEILKWHIKSAKALIDAVIEDEENPANHRNFVKGAEHEKSFYLLGKKDTILKLKAIKELL